jgi:acetoin utilization deacetylase AcuC-like enzyme
MAQFMGDQVAGDSRSRTDDIRQLQQDALQGRVSRRSVLKRSTALGLSGPLLASLIAACSGPERSESRDGLSNETPAPEPESPQATEPTGQDQEPEIEPTSEPDGNSPTPPPGPTAPVDVPTPDPEGNSPTPTSEPDIQPSPTPDNDENDEDRSDTMSAGFVFDESYLNHDPGVWNLPGSSQTFPFSDAVPHPSNHRLVQRTRELINVTGLNQSLVQIAPRMAEISDLTAFHTEGYVEKVRQLAASGGGDAGAGAPVSPASWDVARLAAGGGMAAVDAVANGTARRVFTNVRPPGHHAVADMGMGFCIFNNIVVAARYAQRRYGYQRVMVLDWDVHHGNGTQDAFYNDPSVLFVSLHQDQLFPPGQGEINQSGSGNGAGYTVNLSLPPGSGDATYLAAFDRIILPIANEYRPELVLISAGQDASAMDQLGRMAVTCEGYRQMTQRMIDLAETHAGGRLVAMQEGGYSEIYAPYCTLAIVETMAGTRTGIAEPLTRERMLTQPQTTSVSADGASALQNIINHQSQFWSAF